MVILDGLGPLIHYKLIIYLSLFPTPSIIPAPIILHLRNGSYVQPLRTDVEPAVGGDFYPSCFFFSNLLCMWVSVRFVFVKHALRCSITLPAYTPVVWAQPERAIDLELTDTYAANWHIWSSLNNNKKDWHICDGNKSGLLSYSTSLCSVSVHEIFLCLARREKHQLLHLFSRSWF
jgi:hypothetical protein